MTLWSSEWYGHVLLLWRIENSTIRCIYASLFGYNLIAETRLNGILYSLVFWFQNATKGRMKSWWFRECGALSNRYKTQHSNSVWWLFVTFPLFCSILTKKERIQECEKKVENKPIWLQKSDKLLEIIDCGGFNAFYKWLSRETYTFMDANVYECLSFLSTHRIE